MKKRHSKPRFNIGSKTYYVAEIDYHIPPVLYLVNVLNKYDFFVATPARLERMLNEKV